MKTAKEILTSYSDGDYTQFPGHQNILMAMEEYASQFRSEWISVKERLPEEICDVLVIKTNGKVVQMSFHAPFDSGKRIFQWYGFGVWNDHHRFVTHLMPLPAAPKGGEE